MDAVENILGKTKVQAIYDTTALPLSLFLIWYLDFHFHVSFLLQLLLLS